MTHDLRPDSHLPGRERTETHSTVDRPANPLATSEMQFDLAAESARLQGEDVYARTGRNAITLFKFEDLRVVLMALRAGAKIDGHRAEGRVSIQTLSGGLRLHVAGKDVVLAGGGLLALDRGVAHDVEATKDTVFLLSIVLGDE